ncbi:Epoxide hydrolase 2 [Wallemia ichthyophaga EXF-994]|uniref:Epoxide hydrolase 2 n=1 Tax=Wallemia ichthyophaga (strain EXF-994 / CBS 113033) TaxID=1299270 RepID=R9AJS3_WALI9|nr:Epoxide hydrolase 2 [Wallemia ichthyophaga EXF-994]EOR00276.1 Epoxide hydrolase 2 [Wallemia ichthyophaga EXF-994]TIB36098.1 hypothetical protein E3P84_01044 [Wallemia ichthyophaga]TIB41535.1 hypothetical protein E3P83_01906 [Wallemia ichthyophaga]
MNFDLPESYTLKNANLRGLNWKYVDLLPKSPQKGTFLLVHGFPDTWFSWHTVAKQLVTAGYRCVIPSLVGFCGTDTPDDLKRYTRVEMAHDMAALLEQLEIEQVVAVGHDWGSMAVQRLAAISPSKVEKVILLSVPYTPPATVRCTLESVVEGGFPVFGYQLLWRDDKTIARLESSEPLRKSFFASLFSRPGDKSVRPVGYNWQKLGSEEWAAEMHPHTTHESSLLGAFYEWHVAQFSRFGMRGPCSQYKVWELNSELEVQLELPQRLEQPILQVFFGGESLLSNRQKRMAVESSNDQIKTVIVEDGESHWYLLEKPDTISKLIFEYVDCAGQAKSNL